MDASTETYTTLTDIGKVHAAVVKLLLPITMDNVYKEIVNQGVQLAEGKYGPIFLFNNSKNTFTRAYTTVPKKLQFIPKPKGNTHWVYTYNKPRFVTREELLSTHDDIDPNIHSVILIPLSHQKKKLGVLSLQSNLYTPFNNKHRESLLLFGSVASLAIRKAQLHQQKEKALETRDLFMSAASHEFKTPLSSIRAYAQLIEQKVTSNKPVTEKSIKAIIRNADRLTEMINSLFMASQVSAGTFDSYREHFDLFTTTKQYLGDLSVATTRKFIFSTNVKNIPFYGDKNQWYTVVSNLVRNAINYSPKGSPITITFEVINGFAIFKVANEGEGVSQEDIKRIFEKYFRSKQQKAGLGLGLFLCYQIVKAHQGTIKIESQPNVETVVTVKLPLLYVK
jgi:signal transduction histidine kinase